MGFIFRPLDQGAVRLRGYAQRQAAKLPGARGTSHSIQDGYILRAIGDGNVVVVTAIPMPGVICGAYNGLESGHGVYPGTDQAIAKSVVFVAFKDQKIFNSVFGGTAESLGSFDTFSRYCSSGRILVGDVTQEWPLVNFTTDPNDGWLQSPPDFVIEGQCRLTTSGTINAAPWATRTTVCRSALLTLHAPLYRESHYTPTSSIPTADEHALTLYRMTSMIGHIALADVSPDHPEAIKTDLQADPALRTGGIRSAGIIEFGYDALGISLAEIDGTPRLSLTEGFLEPLGAIEWSATDGVVVARYLTREWLHKLVILRYHISVDAESGAPISSVVWRSTIDSTQDRIFILGGYRQLTSCGVWATRAGRRLSDGTPEQPDKLIMLTDELTFQDYGTDDFGNPLNGTTATQRLVTIDPVSGLTSSINLFVFDRYKFHTGEPLEELAYYHIMGVTLGSGETEVPALVCLRRAIYYWVETVEGVASRIPEAFNRTAFDEIAPVVISHSGAITVIETGSNFLACYKPSVDYANSVHDGKLRLLGFACCRDVAESTGLAGYDFPVCEFAPGYIAMLVVPNSAFTGSWPARIVISNLATGAKIYESANLPFGATMAMGGYYGISCSQHGSVIEVEGVGEVASGGVLMLTAKFPDSAAASSGCFVTLDLGVTLSRVLSSAVLGATMHYVGTALQPAAIGVSP